MSFPLRLRLAAVATAAVVFVALGPAVAASASAASAASAASSSSADSSAPAASSAASTPILQIGDPSRPSNQLSTFHFADSGFSTPTASTTSDLTVTATDADADGLGDPGGVTVEIAPPDGKKLAPGSYDVRYESTGYPAAGSPDVRFTFGSTTSVFTGRLEIVDLAATAAGRLRRYDIVLQGVGELRMGEPETAVRLGARNLLFPRIPVGYKPSYAQETLHNTSSAAVAVGTPAFSGQAAADYTVAQSSCGTTLAAHATCAFLVGSSPKAAGPRDALMSVELGASTQTVSLAGSAPLGTSSIVTSGDDYIDGGGTLSYVNGPSTMIGVGKRLDGYEWFSTKPYGSMEPPVMLSMEKVGGGPLALGTHPTQAFTAPFATSGYGTDITAEGRGCGDYAGSETVKAFGLDSLGVPSIANVTFTEYCKEDPSHLMKGTLLWQWRADTTSPAAPTAVKVTSGSTRTVTWKASASSDRKATIVRLVAGSGANANPGSGVGVFSGSGTSAALPALAASTRYTVVVFAFDQAGNVSRAATVAVTTAAAGPGR